MNNISYRLEKPVKLALEEEGSEFPLINPPLPTSQYDRGMEAGGEADNCVDNGGVSQRSAGHLDCI